MTTIQHAMFTGGFLPKGFPYWLILIPFCIASLMYRLGRSQSLLEEWAARNSYEIIESKYRWLFWGPFFWRASGGEAVYRVKVSDVLGYERSGLVCLGGFWRGLSSDDESVVWDEK